jgi:RNA polymerase sigma-70 factor (ECF subfamily)
MSQPFPSHPDNPTPINIGEPFVNSERPPILVDVEQLIRQAFEQNARQGYELLFRRFYRPLCSHAVRYVYGREVAEDIVSDVFLNFWHTQAYQTIMTTYQAYLFGAVRNRVLNYIRNQALHDSVDAGLVALTNDVVTEDPLQILQCTELYGRIQATITGLPPQCQRVFMLSRFEGKSYSQIAEQLGISVKTVETHLSKALSVLRQMLAGDSLISRR